MREMSERLLEIKARMESGQSCDDLFGDEKKGAEKKSKISFEPHGSNDSKEKANSDDDDGMSTSD